MDTPGLLSCCRNATVHLTCSAVLWLGAVFLSIRSMKQIHVEFLFGSLVCYRQLASEIYHAIYAHVVDTPTTLNEVGYFELRQRAPEAHVDGRWRENFESAFCL